MKTLQVTTKTREEISTAFAAVFKERTPAHPAVKVTQKDRLEPYRKDILQQRRVGFNWKEIAEAMADPRIGEKVSGRLLKELFGAPKKKAPKGVTPPPERYILDPATGRRINPPPQPK